MVTVSNNTVQGNALLWRMSEIIFSMFHHTGDECNVTAKPLRFPL